MKKISLLMFLSFTTAMCCCGQTADTLAGKIILRPESSVPVTLTDNTGFSRGFSIALAGYEVAFTGHDGIEEMPRSMERFKTKNRRRYRGKIAIVDFGFNGLTSPDYSAYSPAQKDFLDLRNGKSIYLAVNALKTSTALDRQGTFGFTTGLSLVWRNYSFSNPVTIHKQGGQVHPLEPEFSSFKKSKLTTFALDVPVVFEANLHKFFVSAGAYGGLVLGSHTKYKSPKTKSRGGHGIELFEYGLTFRAGFRHLYGFGNYGLNGLFKSGAGPKTRTFTVGFGFPF